jgi:hypothetical protein
MKKAQSLYQISFSKTVGKEDGKISKWNQNPVEQNREQFQRAGNIAEAGT